MAGSGLPSPPVSNMSRATSPRIATWPRAIGPDATIYEHYRFGDMLDMLLLDDRQYRSAPACVHGGRPTWVPDCPERTEEARAMLGRPQERWFDARLGDGKGRWTIVAQQ